MQCQYHIDVATLLTMQLIISCTQKPAKNPMQKLPKKPTKTPQKSARQKSSKNLL